METDSRRYLDLPIGRNVGMLFEKMTEPVCKKYGLTRTEKDLMCYLANHPTRNTAKDAVERRGLPKANVSYAVEELMKKQLLTRERDPKDRRQIHLELTEQAAPTAVELCKIRAELEDVIFTGFTDQERECYLNQTDEIIQNIERKLKKK